MKNIALLAIAVVLLAACGGTPTPVPDLVATQIAVEKAAHATMTAEAPTATHTAIEKRALYFLATLGSKSLTTRDLENILFKARPPCGKQFLCENLPPDYLGALRRTKSQPPRFDNPFLRVYEDRKSREEALAKRRFSGRDNWA